MKKKILVGNASSTKEGKDNPNTVLINETG